MLALCLTVLLAAPPPAGAAPMGLPPSKKVVPPAGETAKLFFLAGDVAKAVEWAQRGLKTDPKRCKPMLKALAEYGFLAGKRDDFTPEQARAFLEWDRAISPGVPGKITEPVIARFVTVPLSNARAMALAGQRERARTAVLAVLAVDPKHAQALALEKELALGGPDAGAAGPAPSAPAPPDGGPKALPPPKRP